MQIENLRKIFFGKVGKGFVICRNLCVEVSVKLEWVPLLVVLVVGFPL